MNPPVELTAPDITRWRAGNAGVDWVHRFEAGAEGPVVMVQALAHGTESCWRRASGRAAAR